MDNEEGHAVNLGATSMPLVVREGTGDGSLAASLISNGFVVSRYTPAGTVRPFGQDIGTADDATAVTVISVGVEPNGQSPEQE